LYSPPSFFFYLKKSPVSTLPSEKSPISPSSPSAGNYFLSFKLPLQFAASTPPPTPPPKQPPTPQTPPHHPPTPTPIKTPIPTHFPKLRLSRNPSSRRPLHRPYPHRVLLFLPYRSSLHLSLDDFGTRGLPLPNLLPPGWYVPGFPWSPASFHKLLNLSALLSLHRWRHPEQPPHHLFSQIILCFCDLLRMRTYFVVSSFSRTVSGFFPFRICWAAILVPGSLFTYQRF